jgi:phosphatidylglycerophosphate synthase
MNRYRILSPSEAAIAMSSYHFTPGQYTKLDKLMNPFWVSLSSHIPQSVAPNAITLAGTAIMVLGFLTVLLFEQDYAYIVAAVAVFGYQTLDAVDGKHARNIQLSTPLGGIFDHGCDAAIVPIMGLTLLKAVFPEAFNGQGSRVPIVAVIAAMTAFWITQWEEGVTGQLEHQGVTEAQMVVIAILVGRAFFPGLYSMTVSSGSYGKLEFRDICASLVLGAAVFIISAAISRVSQFRPRSWLGLLPGAVFASASVGLVCSEIFTTDPGYVMAAMTASYWAMSAFTVLGTVAKKNTFKPSMEVLAPFGLTAILRMSLAVQLVVAFELVVASVVVFDSLQKLSKAIGVPIFKVSKNK